MPWIFDSGHFRFHASAEMKPKDLYRRKCGNENRARASGIFIFGFVAISSQRGRDASIRIIGESRRYKKRMSSCHSHSCSRKIDEPFIRNNLIFSPCLRAQMYIITFALPNLMPFILFYLYRNRRIDILGVFSNGTACISTLAIWL